MGDQPAQQPVDPLGAGGIITLQCAQCGFYVKTSNPDIANQLAAVHQAGWGPAHVVSQS